MGVYEVKGESRGRVQRRFLGVGETAELLAVSPASVRRWADQGFLPSYRTPGGQRRFERGEVERMVERMTRRRQRVAVA